MITIARELNRMDNSMASKLNKDTLLEMYFLLWVTMSRVRYGIFRLREAELKPHGISPEQSAVLIVIHGLNNQATPSEIARWLFRKPNTVSAILKVMEKKGFIIKSGDPYVKNLIRVSLTEKGEETLYQATKRKSVGKIMSALSEEECAHLQECFDKLMTKLRAELGIDDRPIFPV